MKTMLPFAVVGYQIGFSQLGPTGLVFTVSYSRRAHGIIVNYYMANPALGKSLCSDWFFLGQDFAVRTVSLETVQAVSKVGKF